MKGSRSACLYLLLIILYIVLGGCSRNSGEDSQGAEDKVETAPLQSPGVQNLVFHSEALDRDMRLSVYLPAGYNASQRYPVLYFIHGYGSRETDIFDGLNLQQNAERLIEAGQIEPLIIVAPQMDNSYGLNAVANPGDPAALGGERYEDYLVKDVVEYTDSHFKTLAERDSRYIGGISMGGFISLHSAFLHSDVYSRVGGHSPALFLDDWSLAGGENGLVQFLYPTEALRQERDPLLLAQNRDLSKLSIYLDCGAEDSYRFYEGTEQLYTLLKEKGVPVEYHLRAGQHDGDYWKSHMDEYLKFYAGRTDGS
ncbi:esterase [Paenibacillus sp. FSL R7-277]|uniref:alpha/beta hydrolase n=1 Tax=Paenibacillus sp. FSL R7-277 TaxID=1227352 RepID=UPI0003E2A0AC|nr:alpha/beta hydrolase-fold protein [Paenibacillus sp. FSL R7-277]ETT72990.1 esterase [Paenibacillus sp. FSL R7-277]